MSRTALIATPALATFLVVLRSVDPAAAVGDERWRRPLPGGAIVAPFTYERAMPYMHGRRRGIDIRARPGTPVLAACSGTIAYAGRVPRFGRGVTIRCGTLTATELGLSKTFLPRGTHITAGSPLGLLGPTATLRLGARLTSDHKAYIDPTPLLRDQPPQLAPLPPAKRLRRIPTSRRHFESHPSPSSPPLLWSAFAGALTLASALLGGTTLRIRRRRLRRAEAVTA